MYIKIKEEQEQDQKKNPRKVMKSFGGKRKEKGNRIQISFEKWLS
jgi:hypothetical protein